MAKIEIGRSRNARINQALHHALEARDCLSKLSGRTHRQHVDEKDAWFDCRNAIEKLAQCFHEASAYNNALLAQRIEHEPSKLGVEGSNPSERATKSAPAAGTSHLRGECDPSVMADYPGADTAVSNGHQNTEAGKD